MIGTEAHLVEVEVHVTTGVPKFTIVGLPSSSVKEAEQRTRSALLSSDERWPPARMVANLAPGALRKEGTHFDLPLALGILAGDGMIDPALLADWILIGELALNGRVRPVRGTLPAAMTCRRERRRGLICPRANAAEALLVEDVEVVPVESLSEAIQFLRGDWLPPPLPPLPPPDEGSTSEDMRDVRGQSEAKRVLELAAAGGHNALSLRLLLRYSHRRVIPGLTEGCVATGTKPKGKPRAAALYCRISQDGEGSRLGVRRQEKDCGELADRRGWPIAAVFVDNDVSAYSGKKRAQYDAMLDAIEDQQIDAVIVWHLDRLTRRPVELEEFFEVCDRAGVRNMACVSGDIDLSTHDGQFHARILAAVARKESDDKSRRIRRKHRELAEAGMHPGTWSMMGYRYDGTTKSLHVVAKEAAIVKRIFQMYADGSGLREIARWLQDQGLVGKRGRKRWTNGGVTRILDNPTYAGLRFYEGDYYPLANAKPIISTEVWEEARRLRRAQASPGERREGKGTTLLAGLMFCSCGEPMWRDTYKTRDERSYYVCRRAARKRWGDCRQGGVSAQRAERIVVQEFISAVSDPYAERLKKINKRHLIGDLGTTTTDDVEQRLTAVEARMERLIELSLSDGGPLAARKFEEKARELETEREQLQRRLGERVVSHLAARRRAHDIDLLRKRLSDLPRVWQVATDEERNQMLRLAIERIEVTGQGRPKKLKISWASWLH